MSQSYQNGSMGNGYGTQGTNNPQQGRKSYGQQGESYMQKQGQNAYQGGNTMNSNQEHNYGQGQNSYQGGNNAMGGAQEQGYNGGSQQQSHMMNGSQGQGQGYQQSGNISGMNGAPGQNSAQYPNSKAPDAMHKFLDRIEKKFGGDRFDETKHPENAAKNQALNENIIKKLTQVMKIVMQRGPSMAMQYGSKLF